jgi:hypothetical protein
MRGDVSTEEMNAMLRFGYNSLDRTNHCTKDELARRRLNGELQKGHGAYLNVGV